MKMEHSKFSSVVLHELNTDLKNSSIPILQYCKILLPNTLTVTNDYQIGLAFIPIAFEIAALYDLTIELYINDYFSNITS